MSSLPVVLIFTYPEHGQANVNLATSYELALAGVNVYIASFEALKTRVSRLQELVVRHALRSGGKPTGSVIFRECKGIIPWGKAVGRYGVNMTNFPHPHSMSGALQMYSRLGALIFPWSPEEYLAVIDSCREIIATIKPNVVVIDTLFHPAVDACKLADQNFMVISPNAIKDLALYVQPCLAALWKYPVVSSGFPFPLKWWQIPLNIYLNIRLFMQLMTSANIKQIGALRESLGVRAVLNLRPYGDVTCICPALPETDFPFAVIPEKILLCGPITIPFDPLEESDLALKKWLDNAPTVMVNLGSHALSDQNLAREMASAFRILLDYHARKGDSKIQVLWKAKANGDIQPVINEIIGKEVEEGRVKVVAWLDAEPVSILQHPNMVCTVHHGGANSYYEGVWSGLPHIVLPVWLDTYEYAARVEFLNVGIFGSQTCAPRVRAEEFGKALVRVTGDTEEAGKFRMSAQQLKEVCRAKGHGRKLASAAILKEAGMKERDTFFESK